MMVTVYWDDEDQDDTYNYDESGCPVCGDTMSYCQGHGAIGDPIGHRIMWAHDNGDHTECHPDTCQGEASFLNYSEFPTFGEYSELHGD